MKREEEAMRFFGPEDAALTSIHELPRSGLLRD
jgi:hypothetical protein